jgi:hypothetical protein
VVAGEIKKKIKIVIKKPEDGPPLSILPPINSRLATLSQIENPKSEMGLPWTDVPLTSAPERPVAARHSINLAL